MQKLKEVRYISFNLKPLFFFKTKIKRKEAIRTRGTAMETAFGGSRI